MPQQSGFTTTRATDQGHDFATGQVEVEILMHHYIAVHCANFTYFADKCWCWLRCLNFSWQFCRAAAHTPISRVKIANNASSKITLVTAVTTELVVLRLKLSVLGLMRKPKWHAIRVTTKPNSKPLT